jgi:hypothetical protein
LIVCIQGPWYVSSLDIYDCTGCGGLVFLTTII